MRIPNTRQTGAPPSFMAARSVIYWLTEELVRWDTTSRLASGIHRPGHPCAGMARAATDGAVSDPAPCT
jgi:hypothetical protein